MAIRNEFGQFVDKVSETVKMMRDNGITDELVLVVDYGFWFNYVPSWERVKEETHVDYVEGEGLLDPNVEFMIMQRSDYLRMVVNKVMKEREEHA